MARVRPLIALLLVLLMAGPAYGTDWYAKDLPRSAPVDNARTRGSLKIAARWWGEQPACAAGGFHFYAAELGTGTKMVADELTCTVWIDRSTLTLDRETYCTYLVHEYGHLLGRSHVSDPRSVMAADTLGDDRYVYSCVARFDRSRLVQLSPFVVRALS